jgi:hypothetical protein
MAAHDVILATVRDFAERSGATGVVVLLDRGPDRPAPTIEAEPGEAVTIAQGGEHLVVPAHDLAGVEPLPLDLPKPVPATAIDADPVTGEVEAPIGVLERLAEAVAELARHLGGRSVVQAEFATRSGTPLALAARVGEDVVVSIGEEQFEIRSG